MYFYEGQWYSVKPRPYEPEIQSVKVAWLQIKKKITSQEAYIEFFKKQREEAKILYPSFRKDDN